MKKCRLVLKAKCGSSTTKPDCPLVCPKAVKPRPRKICKKRAVVKYGSSSDARACTRRVFYVERCVTGVVSISKSCRWTKFFLLFFFLTEVLFLRRSARRSCSSQCSAQNKLASVGKGKWCLPADFVKCVKKAARACVKQSQPACKRVCGAATTTTTKKISTSTKKVCFLFFGLF